MLRARIEETGGEEASRRRTAASMESSSKGLRECLTLVVSMAVREALTRGLTWGGGKGG